MPAPFSGSAASEAAAPENFSGSLAEADKGTLEEDMGDFYEEDLEEEDPPALDMEVDEEPAQTGKAGVGMEEVLAAEAASLPAEVADPTRDLRKEQLQKKAADAAAKEEKKKKGKGKGKGKGAGEKGELEQKQSEPEQPMPGKRRKTQTADLPPAVLPEVPEAQVQPEAEPVTVGPKKRRSAKKKDQEAKAKGRPRKTPGATSASPKKRKAEEKEEQEAGEKKIPKDAGKKPKGNKAATHAYDKAMAADLTEFLREYVSKRYVKSQETLHKVPGMNVYATRHAAGFKLDNGSRSGKQVGYFGLKAAECCSLALNVWLSRKFYDRMVADKLAPEWPDSEEGQAYKVLLVNTGNMALQDLKKKKKGANK